MNSRRAKRFAAKLLFQFRVRSRGTKLIRRTCEERIILVRSTSAQEALAVAKKKGRNAQYKYQNIYGKRVVFQFVGVMRLLSLEPECESDEVWYDIRDRKASAKHLSKLIPPDDELIRHA